MDAHLLLLRQTNLKPPQIVFGSFMFMSPASRLTSELQAKPFLTKKKRRREISTTGYWRFLPGAETRISSEG